MHSNTANSVHQVFSNVYPRVFWPIFAELYVTATPLFPLDLAGALCYSPGRIFAVTDSA